MGEHFTIVNRDELRALQRELDGLRAENEKLSEDNASFSAELGDLKQALKDEKKRRDPLLSTPVGTLMADLETLRADLDEAMTYLAFIRTQWPREKAVYTAQMAGKVSFATIGVDALLAKHGKEKP